jgi:tRNA nucleotidyltransferase/poly(A) polymerase
MLGLPINEYNDFDTVTNIPPMYLEKVFKQVPEVTGLHLLIIDNVKIDIVYEPNLDNLARIAKSRDFLSLFIDPEGNIHDPNGFAMSYMRRQKLYSSLPPAEIFKEDYLRIFRAIYTVSKRVPHFSTIKKQVALDKDFLVPRLINPEDGSIEKLLHPYRFNSWLGKLFSQRMAVKNFAFLIKFHILEILFPHIQQELYADMDWIKNQMLISNNSPFPKITLIYSTFIASALAQRVPVTYSQDCKIYRTEELMRAVIKIYKGSLLFKEAFKDVQELLTVLNRSLIEWKVQHEPTPPEQELDEHQANRLTR